jgi:hypothetical protein
MNAAVEAAFGVIATEFVDLLLWKFLSRDRFKSIISAVIQQSAPSIMLQFPDRWFSASRPKIMNILSGNFGDTETDSNPRSQTFFEDLVDY